MPQATINGFTAYYEEGGTGDPLIFVHGGFANLASRLDPPRPYDWSWEHDFARTFRFIWYDRRGCYRSDATPSGYDLANQAFDLEALLDHLSIPSVHLIGSSAGGPIALLFAATRPTKTRSLVLVGTGLDLFPHGDPASTEIRRLIEVLNQDGPEAAFDRRPTGIELSLDPLWEREEMAARGQLDEWLAHQQTLAQQAAKLPRSERIQAFTTELRSVGAYLDLDLGLSAARVRTPTLVLHGGRDAVVPREWAEELAQSIPGATFLVLGESQHRLLFRGPMSDHARSIAIEFARNSGREKSD